MKISYLTILVLGIMLSEPATAEIYRYVDDSGQLNFTDDFSTIPESKRPKVTEQDEIPSTYHPPAIPKSIESAPVTPSPPEKVPQSEEKLEEKKQLEAEYKALLKEKESLDNNRRFQSRKNRNKYKYRPYIKRLAKKEQQVIKRLAEVEKELGHLNKL